MKINRPILQTALTVLVMSSFVLGSHLVYQNLVSAWNKSLLQDLAQRSILRVELAIDLAVSTMALIEQRGLTSCTPETLAAYQKYVMTVGSIKDIRLRSGGKSCAVFRSDRLRDELQNDSIWEKAHNSTIALTVRTTGRNHALSILWKSKKHDLVVLVSTNGMLYDMAPSALRSSLNMKISLNGGREIAAYHPLDKEQTDSAHSGNHHEREIITLGASSKRYPVKAQLSLDKNKLLAWNHNNSPLIDFLSSLVGLLIGLLAARVAFPPAGPVDEMDKAIANGEFEPFFQPILALDSSEIIGFEMLARWKKEDGSRVAPTTFIPLAENFGRIDAILFALLRQAGLSLGKELRANPHLKLTFNITPEQFLDPEFLPRLSGVLRLVNLPSSSLVAEITERQPLADLDLACYMVDLYKEHGIRIAIDDAGTGHNGLSSIQKLDVATIKLDKIFIDGIVDNKRARQMIEMLVNLARHYQMDVVAEGIETAEQARAAYNMGIEEGQGFYFSRPLCAKELLALLEEQRKPLAQNNEPEQHRILAKARRRKQIRVAS